MGIAWWIGLGIIVVGIAAAGGLVFARHRGAPISTAPDGKPVMPGVGRRLSSAMLLAVLTLGLGGLIAAAAGSIVFLGGLSLSN